MRTSAQAFERNKSILEKYLPKAAVEPITHSINTLNFKLKIKKERSTKLGDYRSPFNGMGHVITVNRNLNQYAFLITLLHEMAHLTNWNKHQRKVKPHGIEWKMEFKALLQPYLNLECFPADVLHALRDYAENPAASSCADPHLLRILKKHDAVQGFLLVEDLPTGTRFYTAKKQLFIKGEKRRTRYLCLEVGTRRQFLFSGLAEVYLADEPNLLLN